MPKKKKQKTKNKRQLSPIPSRDNLEGGRFPKAREEESHSSSFVDLEPKNASVDQPRRPSDHFINDIVQTEPRFTHGKVQENEFYQEKESNPFSNGNSPEFTETDDLNMFMEAIDHIEIEAKGLIAENPLDKRANARRLKQLQNGLIKPDAELDLHGLLVPDAKQKVRHFIDNANFHGLKTVILITGKGLHSSNGPVLRNEIETLLNQLNEKIIEWNLAPSRFGGDGALVVFLKGKNR